MFDNLRKIIMKTIKSFTTVIGVKLHCLSTSLRKSVEDVRDRFNDEGHITTKANLLGGITSVYCSNLALIMHHRCINIHCILHDIHKNVAL